MTPLSSWEAAVVWCFKLLKSSSDRKCFYWRFNLIKCKILICWKKRTQNIISAYITHNATEPLFDITGGSFLSSHRRLHTSLTYKIGREWTYKPGNRGKFVAMNTPFIQTLWQITVIQAFISPAPTPLFSPESDFANLVFPLSHLSSALTPAVFHLIVVRHLAHAGGNGQVNKNRSEKRKESDGVWVGGNEDVLNGWLHRWKCDLCEILL